MEALAVALLLALVKKVVDLYKMFRSGNTDGALTQLLTFAAAVVLVFLFGATPLGASVGVAGLTLAGAGVATKVLVGLLLGSGASVVKDALKAVDNSQTEKVG